MQVICLIRLSYPSVIRRGDTEWNQWVRSEKEQLSQVMERNGIEWERLGTHDEHLSVADYKKVQRIKEVTVLDEIISVKQDEISDLADKKSDISGELSDFLSQIEKTEAKLKTVKEKEKFIAKNASHYDDDPKYALPEPKPLMYAKTYHDKFALPLVRRLKNAIRSILLHFFEKIRKLETSLDSANDKVRYLTENLKTVGFENARLREIDKDYRRLRRYLGGDTTDEIIRNIKAQEREQEAATLKQHIRREYAR